MQNRTEKDYKHKYIFQNNCKHFFYFLNFFLDFFTNLFISGFFTVKINEMILVN